MKTVLHTYNRRLRPVLRNLNHDLLFDMKTERRTIGGIELEMVRFKEPRPHWRVKVVATDYIFESGVFRSGPNKQEVWRDVETVARLCGNRFAKDTLQAHL